MPHGEMAAKKWLNSIEKQKRRIDLKEQRDKHTESTTKIIDSYNRLGAESIIS